MSISRKYGRTFHFPFSEGKTSDDKTNFDWYSDIQKCEEVVVLEKLDGENSCISHIGTFARSHGAENSNPWASHLKLTRSLIIKDLEELGMEIFGENMYAIHSIEYPKLTSYFYVFGIRIDNVWLSWDKVEEYCFLLDLETVPVLNRFNPKDFSEEEIRERILNIIKNSSTFGSIDTSNGLECPMEGVVVRDSSSYISESGLISDKKVFKYVRADHVKTDQHWTKNWKRADLVYKTE